MSFPFNRSNMQLKRQRRRSEREYKQNLCPGYPLEAFPGFVFKPVENVHKTVLSPVPVASQSVLGYMSAIAQGEVDVLITPGLKAKPVSLFLLTGAVSGDRKTTTDNLVNAPLHAYDLQQQKEYDEEMVEYKSSMGVWKIKEKVVAKKLKKLLEDGNETTECEAEYKAIKDDEPVQPERRQMIFGDTTFRGMTEVLPEHSASVCLLSSEAGYIIKQLKQSIPQLNDLWDGDDITTNRVSGRRIIISPEPRLTGWSSLNMWKICCFHPKVELVHPASQLVFYFASRTASRVIALKSLEKTRNRIWQGFINSTKPETGFCKSARQITINVPC